jgi:molybdopterin-guanine dinucleotide biosynthesis protein A
MSDAAQVTGLILAGGLGSRMQGLDKGLQMHDGAALALHALRRLAPQVGEVAINANRNRAAYEAMGVRVVPDSLPDRPGPLAGFLAGLEQCTTPFLVAVPCDAPLLPLDLVVRLQAALDREAAELAMAATREFGELRLQPTFCLMRVEVGASLRRFLAGGQRKVTAWTATLRTAVVVFDDRAAFANVNTLADLDALPTRS